MQQDQIPDAPTWPWIVGLILTALAILGRVIHKIYGQKESTQTTLVNILNKEIERRDKADEKRDDEMKAIIDSHERSMKSFSLTLKRALDDNSDRHDAAMERLADRLERRQDRQ